MFYSCMGMESNNVACKYCTLFWHNMHNMLGHQTYAIGLYVTKSEASNKK